MALRAAQMPGLSHAEAMLCSATRKEHTQTEQLWSWGQVLLSSVTLGERHSLVLAPRRTEVPG